MAVYIIEMES